MFRKPTSNTNNTNNTNAPEQPKFSADNTAKRPQDYLIFGAGFCFSKKTTTTPAKDQSMNDSNEYRFRNMMNGGFGN